MKTRGEIRRSGKVSISCSAWGTRHDVPYVVSRNETYSWQQYHGLQMSLATTRECQMMVTTLCFCVYYNNFNNEYLIVHYKHIHDLVLPTGCVLYMQNFLKKSPYTSSLIIQSIPIMTYMYMYQALWFSYIGSNINKNCAIFSFH